MHGEDFGNGKYQKVEFLSTYKRRVSIKQNPRMINQQEKLDYYRNFMIPHGI
jgi:hypothetical protein